MRFAFWVGMAALACTQVQASYELMYVLDGAGPTKGIHRFDPISGAYLGQFGQTLLNNPRSIAVGPQGHVYVLDVAYAGVSFGSRVRVFDGSTGEITGSFALDSAISLNSKIAVSSNGEVMVSSGSFYGAGYALHFSAIGAILGYAAAPHGFSAGGVGYFGSAVAFASMDSTTTFMNFSTFAMDVQSATEEFSFGTGVSTTNISVNGSAGVIASNNLYSRFVRYGDHLSQQSTGAVPVLSSVFGIGLGHANIAHAIGFSSSAPTDFRISTFDSTSGDSLGYRSYGTLVKNPLDAAIVVAPEPASIAAMAVGIAMLVRTRRHSAS